MERIYGREKKLLEEMDLKKKKAAESLKENKQTNISKCALEKHKTTRTN